jgi:hypothetical protein
LWLSTWLGWDKPRRLKYISRCACKGVSREN